MKKPKRLNVEIALSLFSFIFLAWLTGNHPLESRGKHFKNIREKNMLYYEENDRKYPIFRNEYWRVIKVYH